MSFTFYSRTKWQVAATKYRKDRLEELRVDLRDHCEKSLRAFSHDLAIGGLLDFGNATTKVRSPSRFCVIYLYSIFFKTNDLCERSELQVAQTLRQNLTQVVEEILCEMPRLCVAHAGGDDLPITHRDLNATLAVSSQRFTSLREQATDLVRASWLIELNCINFFPSQANEIITNGVSWVQDAERRKADEVIQEKSQFFQGARRSAQDRAEQYMQEDEARFVRRLQPLSLG
jgi:hypothetical protein